MRSSSRCADDVRDLRLLQGSSVPRAGCWEMGDVRRYLAVTSIER